jgi:hypothetical protein
MAIAKFEELLHMVMTKVHKHETVFGTLIPAMMKGELTFQYLASGNSIVSLQYAFRISENTKVGTKVMPPFFFNVIPDRVFCLTFACIQHHISEK